VSNTSIFVAVAGAGLLTTCFAAEPELSDAAQAGQRTYAYYCQDCHGSEGTGKGPIAVVLKVKPANLTTLAKKNRGEFPLERVVRSIDGRQRTVAHGTKMPIWGLEFQDRSSDANQEEDVRRRIEQLVEYLRTLQR